MWRIDNDGREEGREEREMEGWRREGEREERNKVLLGSDKVSEGLSSRARSNRVKGWRWKLVCILFLIGSSKRGFSGLCQRCSLEEKHPRQREQQVQRS